MSQSPNHSAAHPASAFASAVDHLFPDDANGDRPLEIRGKHLCEDVSEAVGLQGFAVARDKQFELRNLSRSGLMRYRGVPLQAVDDAKKAVCKCGHALAFGSDGLTITGHKFEDGSVKARVSGVQTCKRVWLCAVCASYRAAHDAAEIAAMSLWATAKGYTLAMMTLTVRHHSKMSLSSMLDAMPKAWAAVQCRSAFKNFVKAECIGMVRAVEITFGDSGWHPHYHIVFVMNCSSDEAVRRLSQVKVDWLKCLKGVGLEASGKRGFDVRPMANADEYLTKFGNPFEIVGQCTKEGRKGNRTAWQLLDAFGHGDLEAGDRWVEYAVATMRRQRVVWSNGLKALCGADQLDPEEAKPSEVVFSHTITDYDQRERARLRLGVLLRSVEQCRDGDYLGAFLRCLNGETRDFDVWRRLWPYRGPSTRAIPKSLSSIPRK